MKPAAPEPTAPRSTRSRTYVAIFLPLGLLGFAISFYLTYQRNEPLPIPARLPVPSFSFQASSAPPFFEEGPPPPAPSASR